MIAAEDRIVAQLADGPQPFAALMRASGLSHQLTRQALERMRDNGRIVARGRTGGMRYQLPGETRPPRLTTRASELPDSVVCPFCGGQPGRCHGCAGIGSVAPERAETLVTQIWPRAECCTACDRLIKAGIVQPKARKDAA